MKKIIAIAALALLAGCTQTNNTYNKKTAAAMVDIGAIKNLAPIGRTFQVSKNTIALGKICGPGNIYGYNIACSFTGSSNDAFGGDSIQYFNFKLNFTDTLTFKNKNHGKK